MPFTTSYNNFKIILLVSILVLFAAFSSFSQTHDLEVSIGDLSTDEGQTNFEVPIYFTNKVDQVAGFQIWLQNNRPDVMEYTLGFDTIGTLIQGWYISTNSLGGTNQDLLVTANYKITESNYIQPQNGDILLKIYLDVYDVPEDEVVEMNINTSFFSHFGFSDPDGNLLALTYNQFEDTTYWQCLTWSGDVCLNWMITNNPLLADSISISLDSSAVLDTTIFKVTSGTLLVNNTNFICGDMNADNSFNISDITYLVAYMFSGGLEPTPIQAADCNGDGQITISDLTCFVCYMFTGCLPPTCGL